MGAGVLRFIWLGQVPIFLRTFLLLTPFSAIVLQSTNFKPSWLFHLAWFFLADIYCFLSVYFSFYFSIYSVCSTPAFGCSRGVIAFQPPGKRSYKLSDRVSSFVLGRPGLARCSGIPSKYPFGNVPVPVGGWISMAVLSTSVFFPLPSADQGCVYLCPIGPGAEDTSHHMWAYLQSRKISPSFLSGRSCWLTLYFCWNLWLDIHAIGHLRKRP